VSYQLFEGAKDIKIMKNENDRKTFDQFKQRFGYKIDMDFITFCASIGIYKLYRENTKIQILKGPKKHANITAFSNSKIFDYLILNSLEIKEDRMKFFQNLFYTGLKILEKWNNQFGEYIESELECLCSIKEHINEL